jgi:hypothetical protein
MVPSATKVPFEKLPPTRIGESDAIAVSEIVEEVKVVEEVPVKEAE